MRLPRVRIDAVPSSFISRTASLRGWMAALNNATIMAVLFVVIGAKLVGDAVTAFFS